MSEPLAPLSDRWLVCSRVSDPNRLVIEGQIHEPCKSCGEIVAVSPSGQSALAQYPGTFDVRCLECFAAADTSKTICMWAKGAAEERSGLAS